MVKRVCKRWTRKEDLLLGDLYRDFPLKVIYSYFPKRTNNAVKQRIFSLGLSKKGRNIRRKTTYICKDDYFSVPNLQNSYWAGFIAAGGRINDRGHLEIGLSSKDSNHLESFIKEAGFTGRVITSIKHNKVYGSSKMSRVSICCAKRWKKDLESKFSIIPRKTFCLVPPNLNDLNLCLSYIIGYIDGDGCIWSPSCDSNKINLEILGTRKILYWIRDCFSYIDKSSLGRSIESKASIYRLRFKGRLAKRILGVLAEIDVPKLKRKWSKVYNITEESNE